MTSLLFSLNALISVFLSIAPYAMANNGETKFSETTENSVIKLVIEHRAKIAEEQRFLRQCECPRKGRFFEKHGEACFRSLGSSAQDCGGLAYFLCTGKNGSIEEIANRNRAKKTITKMEGIHSDKSSHHKPYTIYELMTEFIPGEFSFQHYFTFLDGTRYISKNDGDAVRIFSSFGDMLIRDGFAGRQMLTKNREATIDLREVYFADREVCDRNDFTFTQEEFAIFENSLTDEEKQFFKSRLGTK